MLIAIIEAISLHLPTIATSSRGAGLCHDRFIVASIRSILIPLHLGALQLDIY